MPTGTGAIWKPITTLGILGLVLTGCGGEGPTTNPINNSISSIRTMTPRVQPFSELDDDEQPTSESLIATFVITPEQLTQIAESSTDLTPQTLGSCLECFSDPDPQPSQDRETRQLGIYEPDDLTLQLQFRIPDSTSVGQVSGSVRFQIDTTTQLLNPGYGAQLQILSATLQDAAESPQQQVEASALSDPVDFPEKEITRGQSSTRSIRMSFAEVPFQTRYLQLKVMITSPIPGNDQPGQVAPPPDGKLYTGLWLGSDLDLGQIEAHQEGLDKSSAWVGFISSWDSGSAFPVEQATSIRSQGSVPYVRVILPETGEQAEAIRSGERDEAIQAWGEAIRAFKSPVILGVGPRESAELPEDAETEQIPIYQYFVNQIQPQQIPNLAWVYHPDLEAEDLSQAYPGDSWVDWIALELSVDPNAEETLQAQMDRIYPRVAALSARKPIVLSSLRLTAVPEEATSTISGLESSLQELIGKRWPRLIGLAWDGSSVSLQDAPEIAEMLKQTIGSSDAVLGRVITTVPTATSAPTPQPSPTGSLTPASDPPPSANPEGTLDLEQIQKEPDSPVQLSEDQQPAIQSQPGIDRP